jgi:hypothetical protein
VSLAGEVREVVVIGGSFERYAPDALGVKFFGAKTNVASSSSSEDASASDLSPVRAAMKKLRPDHPRKLLINAVLEGESFAERGERDEAMYAVCSTIAWLSPARRPEMTPEILAELLRPSLEVWASEADAEKPIEEEMEKAVEKFESAFDNRAEDDAKRFADAEKIRRGLKLDGQEVDEKTVNGTSRFYAVVQAPKNQYFVWNFAKQEVPLPGEGYRVVDQSLLFAVCKDFWSNCSDGFSLRTYEQGKDKIKSDRQIIDEYGSPALSVIGHLNLQESYFDIGTREFHRAMCPFRVTKAERDPDIEGWLTLFGASAHDKFLDWLALIPRLDQANSALYLEGDKDVGKDLFASGVAQLWRPNGPSKYNRLTSSRFNTDMFACPFVWLNEGIDSTIRHSSVFIRELVAATSHDLEGKYDNVTRVIGAIRLYIAANNDNVLATIASEDMSEGDLPAVVQRFFHVKADPRSATYLKDHKRDLRSWVEDDRIARHVLWLAKTRATELADGKFLVEGEASSIHRALINRGDKNELVLEWLANFIERPNKVLQAYASGGGPPLARVGDGGVFVNTKAFVDHQNIYRGGKELDRKLILLPGVASRILARLAGGRQRRFGDGRERYHAVNPERVFEWAERAQIGDVEVMKRNLAKVIEE